MSLTLDEITEDDDQCSRRSNSFSHLTGNDGSEEVLVCVQLKLKCTLPDWATVRQLIRKTQRQTERLVRFLDACFLEGTSLPTNTVSLAKRKTETYMH